NKLSQWPKIAVFYRIICPLALTEMRLKLPSICLMTFAFLLGGFNHLIIYCHSVRLNSSSRGWPMISLNTAQNHLDRWLLRPFSTLSEIDQRNARLIAAMSLVAVLAVGIRTFVYPSSLMYIAAFVMVCAAYGLSR